MNDLVKPTGKLAERKESRPSYKLETLRYLHSGAGPLFPPSYQEYSTARLDCPICGQDVVRLYLVAPGKVEQSGAAYHHGPLMLVFRHPNDQEEPPKPIFGDELLDLSEAKLPEAVELRSCRVACQISDLPKADISLIIETLRKMKRGGELVERRPRLLERADAG